MKRLLVLITVVVLLFACTGCANSEFSEYKNVSYKDLARYPDRYKGEKIAVNGKVVGVVDRADGSVRLQVWMNNVMNDNYLVYFYPAPNQSEILINDQITAYVLGAGKAQNAPCGIADAIKNSANGGELLVSDTFE